MKMKSSVVQRPFPKTESTNKILLALQCWAGDQAQAMRLARFIADLQPRHSEQADFLFVARFDCPHDRDTVSYVSAKFNTHTFISRQRAKGWPHGPNTLWFETMNHVSDQIEKKKFIHYKAVFTFEADCVPLSPDWITHFHREFDVANARRPTYVMGALLPSPGEHINGNMLVKCDLAFLRWLTKTVSASPPSAGWDYFLARDFKRWGWSEMPKQLSWWGAQTLPEVTINELFAAGIIFHHGCKDDSLLNAARQRLL